MLPPGQDVEKSLLTLRTNDPGDLPESSHIKKTLEHPDANTGRFVGSRVGIVTFENGVFVNYRRHQHNQYRQSLGRGFHEAFCNSRICVQTCYD